MSSIVIVTDSAADIDPSLCQSLGIGVVPLKINFGSESYIDGVDINPDSFYQKLRTSSVMPTTSQPSPIDFAEKYREIVDRHGKDVSIITITLSAVLSGTHQSAVIGKSMMEEDLDITVVDSKKASFVYGMIAVEAARAVQAGKSKQQVLNLIERMIHDVRVYFLVETLEYLQKNGRIGKAASLFGTLLNIKPILTLDPEGTVQPFEKVRGSKKAIARILEETRRYADGQAIKVAILHADVEEQAASLMAQMKSEFTIEESFLSNIGPVIGSHVGPGTLGVMFCKLGK